MFESPDALRKFALEVSSQLRSEGFNEHSEILEHRANLACTTGSEWLGELGLGVEKIIGLGSITSVIEAKLSKILSAAKSSAPYG